MVPTCFPKCETRNFVGVEALLQSRYHESVEGLVVQPRVTPASDGTLLAVTQQEAGWEYLSFRVWQLAAGQTLEDHTQQEEVGLVVLRGRVTIQSQGGRWEGIGERANVFDGKPYVVYLPPRTPFTLTAADDCEIARAGAKAQHGAAARLITPAEIGEEVRGEGNAQRTIRHVLEADRPAEHLFLVEVITPSGNWSSYPPHKHDTNDPPRETYLEETYYHRLQPVQGFGFQRVYTPDRSLDETVVIRDGLLVLVPRGYHVTVVAPGYELYYLNVMAGPVRAWHFTTDPDHSWVAASWQPYGAAQR
jgi:5-deoxy-glucuronate isomerase